MPLLQIAKDGPITTLTIDRAETMNPLGAAGDGDEFTAACTAINRDYDTRCVILTGAGRAAISRRCAIRPADLAGRPR